MNHKICISLCAAALLMASGCKKESGSIEEREERDPLVNTGQAYMEQKQWDQAIDAFKQALDAEPRMARPHLDLAMIYQQYKVNYIHAIYHYDRYLELRPDSEKAEFIEEQKLKVAQALANTLINNSPEVKQVVAEVQRLRAENAALKQQTPSGAPAQTSGQPTTTVTEAVPKKAADAPTEGSAGHQIYHVAAGDNLTKIAQKFYGNGDWEPIFEANKDALKSPSDLRVGQTLVIPNPAQ
jgi:tetratricopeptide (TPR) repeat protein